MYTFIYLMIKVVGQEVRTLTVLSGVIMLTLRRANVPGHNVTHNLSISNWNTRRQGTVAGLGPKSGNCRQVLALVGIDRSPLLTK